MGELVQIRDFKTREERKLQSRQKQLEAELASRPGMAELIAESVCELPEVWPEFYHAPDRDPA